MNTSDWALVISLCSVAIATASFVWNIWSKFIYPKPRLVVSVRVMSIFQAGTWSHKHLNLTVVNHGPIKTTVHCTIVRERDHLLSKMRWGMLNPINDFPRTPYSSHGPFSGGLPKDLEVGESLTLYFPYDADGFLGGPIVDIGVSDIFDSNHWAKRRQVKTLLKNFRNDFPDAPNRKAGVSSTANKKAQEEEA